MREIRFEVKDDALIRHTSVPEIGEKIYKSEVVLTKKIFQECYEKWIKPQETSQESEEEKSCGNCKWRNNERICNPIACEVMARDHHGLWRSAESEE